MASIISHKRNSRPHVGYTLDGGGTWRTRRARTFSATTSQSSITVNIHPAIAKGRMTNAVRILAFLPWIPWQPPAEVSERQGFLHPYKIDGGVALTTIYITTARCWYYADSLEKATLLHTIADLLMAEHHGAKIDVRVTPQYRNMAEGLAKEPRALDFAEEAMSARRAESRAAPSLRRSTDGSR